MAIFEDIFASGDFSLWGGTIGAPAIVQSTVFTGDNAMESSASGEYATVTFTEQSTCYARIYYRTATTPPTNSYEIPFTLYDGVNPVAQMHIRTDSGDSRYIRCRRYYPSQVDYSAYVTLNADTWYWLEMKFVSGASEKYEYFLDGTDIYSTSPNVDTSGASGINAIRVGDQLSGYAHNSYFDAVEVNSTYIGEYVAPEAGVTQGILAQFM